MNYYEVVRVPSGWQLIANRGPGQDVRHYTSRVKLWFACRYLEINGFRRVV